MYTILNRDFIYNNNSVVYFTNKKIYDNRGFFTVGFNKESFKSEINSNFDIIQHNISASKYKVVRGLHFQIENNQAKLVHCLTGTAIDIIVDMRCNSPFFGQGKAYLLDSLNIYLYVPHGFAHGFISINETSNTVFEYFVDDIWNKNSEYVLNFQDYISNNNIYLSNSRNEMQLLNELPIIKNIELEFSAKDFNIAKTYFSDENSINEFKELVKNNKFFN